MIEQEFARRQQLAQSANNGAAPQT